MAERKRKIGKGEREKRKDTLGFTMFVCFVEREGRGGGEDSPSQTAIWPFGINIFNLYVALLARSSYVHFFALSYTLKEQNHRVSPSSSSSPPLFSHNRLSIS